MKLINVKNSTDFIKEIESIVKQKNVEYFEAVLLYCELNNLEVETAASLVKQNAILKAKIQVEAEMINMVKKSSARLPV